MLTQDELNKCNDEGGCPIEGAFYGTRLSVGVQIFFAIAFCIVFFTQLGFGIKGRMWSFTIWMTIGMGFEVVGYLARAYEAKNPFSVKAYIAEFITILLAPTFLAAALSVTFKHIVLYYDAHWSVFKPKLYPLVFVGTDFISIFIQFVGGVASASAATNGGDNQTLVDFGGGAVLVGVIFQVVNMLCCSALMLLYAKRRKSAYKSGKVTRTPPQQNYVMNGFNTTAQTGPPSSYGAGSPPPQAAPHSHDSEQANFSKRSPQTATEERWAKLFVWALIIAYYLSSSVVPTVSSIFEAIPSIKSDVKGKPGLLYVFDSAAILLSCALITAMHPAVFFPAMKPRKGKGEYQHVYETH